MNRRQAIAALFGAPVVASIGSASTERERIAVTLDGQEVASFVVEKSPFRRIHRIELTDTKATNRYYALVKTGRNDVAEMKRLAARGELGEHRACGAPEHA
jgi:hypothetical protein